jgi:hypothetical protein
LGGDIVKRKKLILYIFLILTIIWYYFFNQNRQPIDNTQNIVTENNVSTDDTDKNQKNSDNNSEKHNDTVKDVIKKTEIKPTLKNNNTHTPKNYNSEWYYHVPHDSVSNKKTYLAVIESKGYFELDFPYQGKQKAKLILRTDNKGKKNVLLSIGKGQLLCIPQGCHIKIRFDQGKYMQFAASKIQNNDATDLRINDYEKFASIMMKSKKIFIQVTFFDQGTRVFEFNVQGFNIQKYRP